MVEVLAHLEALLHVGFNDLLQLPQTQDSLRRLKSSSWAETVLDDFLRFTDVYASFRDSLVSIQQLLSEAQVAVRRRDACGLSSLSKDVKKEEKEVLRLASLLRDMGRMPSAQDCYEAGDVELAMLKEVKSLMASVSATIFIGLAGALSASITSSTAFSSSSSWTVLRKRVTSPTPEEEQGKLKLGSLKELEEVVLRLERGCQRVFRSFVNTRVSLLNIFTP